MTNELIEAAQDSEDSSAERYEKAKKKQAGTDMGPAEKRYEELKEEAKEEFIKKQIKQKKEDEESERQEEDLEEEKEDGFVTY